MVSGKRFGGCPYRLKTNGRGLAAANPRHADHDHGPRKARGILCFDCNGLGRFKNSPDLLQRRSAT